MTWAPWIRFEKWMGLMRWAGASTAAAMLIACAGSLGGQDPTSAARLRAVTDRLDLVDLIHGYAYGVDTLERDVLAGVFTEDAVMEVVYVDPPAPMATIKGFESIFARVNEVQGVRSEYAPPWHFVSNERVEINADRAQMTAYLHNRFHKVGGMYYFDAARGPAGWRLTKLRVELLYKGP